MLNEPTKPKKTIHASEIIARLYIIERDQKETDINIKKWADGLLLNEHLKLINKLSKGAFDISSKSKQIVTYFHCIKILLKKIKRFRPKGRKRLLSWYHQCSRKA